MQNIVMKLVLIVAVLGLCIVSIRYKSLRLGKDLQGGVSLLYKVDVGDAARPQEVLNQTITTLKDRVNPKGVFDISMQPVGRDRIEIVMPLPNEEVRALDRAYQASLDALLRESEIRPNTLDEALRRGAALAEIGGSSETDRGRLVATLQEAYDTQLGARQRLADALEDGEADRAIRVLESEVAAAEIDFESRRRGVLALSLPEGRVRRTLDLPTKPVRVKDDAGEPVRNEAGEDVFGPSQREIALEAMRNEFPHLAIQIEIARVAYDVYQSERTGFDDPEDLKRLLRGAGVLEFRIAVTSSKAEGVDVDDMRNQLREVGPDNATSPVARWYPINELKQWYEKPEQLALLEADPVNYFSGGGRDLVADVHEGEYYLLLYTTGIKTMTHQDERDWSLVRTFPQPDDLGRPAVAFNLDAAGGSLMGRLTASNIGQPMAIVLDGEIYSAPTIQSQITTNGTITGSFSRAEINYLTKVLAAGSLQARLSEEPISVSILGPSIGADNLNRGRMAFIIALAAVAVFMVFYYFFAGIVAVIALVANGVIIFGVMMGIDGTFTLPGLAGIVLTIGMAVDANVLIYERIREEIFDGELDLRGAIRQGYRKALSTILDANITNLIVCFVLFQTATTEVKGFALTLTIGICATLFTALFVTRQIYYLYTDVLKMRRLSMLPTVFPAIHRALEPNIDWIRLRTIFWTCSAIAVAASIALVAGRGVEMLDTEFRGGVSLTMATAVEGEVDPADPLAEPARRLLRHSGTPESVEGRIRAIAAAGGAGDGEQQRILAELAKSSVLTVGETSTDDAGNVIASRFNVKVATPKGLDDDATITKTIVEAIVEEFGNELDVTPPLAFSGAGSSDSGPYVFPITRDELGQNIDRPRATQRIPEFLGGAAIVLANIDPPVTEEDVVARIDRMRRQPDFVRYSARDVAAFGLEPAADGGYTALAVVVFDPFRSYLKVDPQVWYDEVADAEWTLVSRALQQPASLEQVSSFSSAVAETLSAQAIVAVVLTLLGILVYIWVRFGSLRYSVAAIVALVHDVIISLGMLALSGVVGATVFGSALLIEPFRIDLGIVAALLTIIGYSLNDTIVILDRVRENRGKLPIPTAPIVNRSINQTVSRTLLTSVTTLVAVGIMYAEGGSGIRPFTYCLLVGLVVGTYSSLAIAAPLVVRGGGDRPDEVGAQATRRGEQAVGLTEVS